MNRNLNFNFGYAVRNCCLNLPLWATRVLVFFFSSCSASLIFSEDSSPGSMGKQVAKKITWVIKSFSSLPPAKISSDQFEVGGCKWCLSVYPKGNNVDYLSLYLEVANHGSLPSGWRRLAKFAFTIVNKLPEKIFKLNEYQLWFEQNAFSWGLTSMLPLDKLHAKDGGFLVNNELKIVAEVDVLEVIGKLDVTEETSTLMETMDVNGFQLLPAQAKSVSCMFERHPEIATEFRPKNPNLRKGYMSLLLSLIETMCQLPQEISKDDMCDAYAALGFMRYAGFKLDWLEKKLDELSENKEKEEACETHMQEMEEELKDLKQKWLDMETLVEKEKAKVSAAKASLSFDDVV